MCYDKLEKEEPDPHKLIEKVKQTEFPHVLFSMRAKKLNVREYFAKKYDFGKLILLMKTTKGNCKPQSKSETNNDQT